MFRTSNKTITILAVLAALVLATIACNFPASKLSNSQAGPKSNATLEPTISSAQAPVIEQSSGATPFSITLTEGQLNDIIQQALDQQTTQQIQNVQLKLHPGFVYISGTATQNGLSLPLNLKIAVNPDGQGSIKFQVVSGTVGPLPLPSSMRDQIETLLNQKLQPVVSQLTSGMYIETVTIDEGVMTVTGHSQ